MFALGLLLAATEPPPLPARIAAADRALARARDRLAQERAPLARVIAAVRAAPGEPQATQARALYRALAPVVAARTAPIEQRIAALAMERDAAVAALEAETARAYARESAAALRLARLPTPLPPPGRAAGPAITPAFAMPAAGRVVSGTGERLETGVRARGLTLATAAGARVAAPAAARIVYARRFGGYGGVVILDHGHGWTTLLAGLDEITARDGSAVAAGATLGTMGGILGAPPPRLTIELRHHRRPVDVAAMAATATIADRSHRPRKPVSHRFISG